MLAARILLLGGAGVFSKIKTFVKKLPLSNYIVFLLCLCAVLLLMFFSIFINLYNDATARNNLIYNRSMTALYAEKANSHISSLSASAQTLCTNSLLTDYVQNMQSGSSPSRELRRTVNRWLISNTDVYDIILTNGTQKTAFYTEADVLSSLVLGNSDDGIVATAFVNNNQMFLIPVKIKHNARNIGVCYLVTYSKTFRQLFGDEMSIADTEFFVLSNSLSILASPPDTSHTHGAAIGSLLFDHPDMYEFRDTIDKEEYFINRQPLSLGGVSLYGITPCRASFGDLLSRDPYFPVLFGVALILLLLIVYWFFYSLNRSIGTLRRFITDKKRKTEESEPVPDLFSTELSSIAVEIDDTIDSIKALEHENLQIKIAHKDSQIKALQSQLNPHFLYNALNCVVGMARYYKMDQIEQVCMSIAKITQYSLSANLLTTIGEEMKIVNNYITVQQIRFPDKFAFHVNVDEALLERKILRFSLQPLIENALKYGIEPLTESGILCVNGYSDGENIIFQIIDNGGGFESEMLAEIQSRLNEKSEEPLQSKKGCGIGILNIHNRIKLYYGADYGLQISSSKNGTTITVKMPLILPEDR